MKASVQTNFKNDYKASYVAKDIAKFFNKGSSIENKIETVLNSLRNELNVKSLKQIDNQIIEAFTATLQDKIERGDLIKHTAETYLSAMNRVVHYSNHFLNKNLETIKQSEVGLTRESFQYTDRSIDQNTHNAFLSFLSNQQDIKAQALAHSVELQRAFGLRLRESLALKEKTIENALKTGILHLTKSDGTKNSRTRDIPIRYEEQRKILQSALEFQKENNLKSLIPTERLKEQYSYACKQETNFNKTHSDYYYHFHGERHTYAQQRLEEEASRLEISQELGHNREEITKIYAKK